MNISIFWDNGTSQQFTAEKNVLNSFILTPPEQSKKVTVTTRFPVNDVHGIWYNACDGGPAARLLWNVEFNSGLQSYIPYIAFFNRASMLRGSIALTNLIDDSKFHAALNQELCTYDITVEISITPETPEFQLLLDLRTEITWQQSLESWRKAQNVALPTFPAAAWDPVFCTWYAVHAAVTADWVERCVPLMLDCGFTTLIVDDGWCYEDMKRVSPETLPVWYEKVGDWEVSPVKFPDFTAHVQRMQALGVKYMLWVAPHFIGVKSRAYTEYAGKTHNTVHEGTAHLNAANRETAEAVSSKLAQLAAEHGLNGLKIDFLNIVSNDVNNPNGRDTLHLIKKLTGALRENDPDSLIEFRQAYATLATMPYATQFRAGDVPFDWMLNFARLVTIRLCMGDNIPIHADPAYWATGESPENIARHMISTLVGVPMLSMDLEKFSSQEKLIVSYWIGFYNQHRDLLNHGHWEFMFGCRDIDGAIVANAQQRIVFLLDAGRLPEILALGKNTIILNLSAQVLEVPEAETFACTGRPGVSGRISLGGWGQI